MHTALNFITLHKGVCTIGNIIINSVLIIHLSVSFLAAPAPLASLYLQVARDDLGVDSQKPTVRGPDNA